MTGNKDVISNQGSDQQATNSVGSSNAERITSLNVGSAMFSADPATNKIALQIDGGDKQWLEPQQVESLSTMLSQYKGQSPQ